MKILLVHNYYQKPGGEDQVFHDEYHLLKTYGHDVTQFAVHNNQIQDLSKVDLIRTTLWGTAVSNKILTLFRKVKPAIVHFHNTFPLVSPRAYQIAKNEGIGVVQTLHNYRFLCPNAIFFRNGNVCEDCLNRSLTWPGVLHGCYRKSYSASAVVASMLLLHRNQKAGVAGVDRFIALTEFARRKFIEGGFPAAKLSVKPNFISPDPGIGKGEGKYAIFVGRLSPEKGIETLLQAWKELGHIIPLKIVGSGQENEIVKKASEDGVGIEWLGQRKRTEVIQLMKNALVLIFPSEWYEGFPMTIVEAYAVGLPVIGSKIGGLESLILHKKTGLHFTPGEPKDLIEKVKMLLEHKDDLLKMRVKARDEYEKKYSESQNYERLMDVYRQAVDSPPSASEILP